MVMYKYSFRFWNVIILVLICKQPDCGYVLWFTLSNLSRFEFVNMGHNLQLKTLEILD